MRANKSIVTVYILAAINIILFLLSTDICLYPDTGSYIDAALYLSEGKLHPLRTPIYPIYIGLMRVMFGQSLYMKMAVIIQGLVFLLSIRYFYKSALKVISSGTIAIYVTLFYSLCTGIFTWCDTILTETFALTGSVLFLYYSLCLFEKYSLKRLLQVTVVFVFLVLLRPAFVYLIGVMALVWIVTYLKTAKRKEATGGFISVGVTIIVLLSYMSVFQYYYGIFSTSRVSLQNRESNYRAYGLYNPEVITDPNFKADVEESYKKYGQRPDIDFSKYYDNEVTKEWSKITKKYSFAVRQDALNKSLMSHPLQNIKSVCGRAIRAANKGLFANYTIRGGGTYNFIANYIGMFNVKFIYLYVFLLIYMIVFSVWTYHQKTWAIYSIMLLMMGIANLFVAIAGAQEEWPRLVLPSIPIYIIMLGQLCNFIDLCPERDYKFK